MQGLISDPRVLGIDFESFISKYFLFKLNILVSMECINESADCANNPEFAIVIKAKVSKVFFISLILWLFLLRQNK